MCASMVKRSMHTEACLHTLAHTGRNSCVEYTFMHQEQQNQSANQPNNQSFRELQWFHVGFFSPSGAQAVVLVNLGSMFWLAEVMYDSSCLGRFSCHTGAKGVLSFQRGPCGKGLDRCLWMCAYYMLVCGVQGHVWIKVSDYYYVCA